MGLDIRLPIGLLFSQFGLLLTVFGLFSNQALYRQSLGINVNFAGELSCCCLGSSWPARAPRA